MKGDFRDDLDKELFGDDESSASLVLVVSPPGCGKTHHINEVRKRLEEEKKIKVHGFDCSSDTLVSSTLAGELNK